MEIEKPGFTDLLDLISKIDRYIETMMEKQTNNNSLHISQRIIEKMARNAEIIFDIISIIWLLYPDKFYEFLRDNARDPLIEKSFYPLRFIDEYELKEGKGIKSSVYKQMISYIKSVDIETLRNNTNQLNHRLLEWLDKFHSEESVINEGEILREDKLYWLSSVVCAYFSEFPIQKTGKILQLSRMAYEENDDQSMNVIYSGLSETMDLPEKKVWYEQEVSKFPKLPR